MASDLHCELIPIHNYWAGYLEEQNLSSKDLVLSDARYPNERGHQVIAEAMIKWLNNFFDHHPFLPEVFIFHIYNFMLGYNLQ